MKKIAFVIGALVVAGALAGAVACDDNNTNETTHEHKWGEWTTVKAATMFEDGEEQRVCADDAEHTETRAITAIGKTPAVFDAFVTYASGCTQGEKGIILNTDTEEETGASTFFGEEDKNLDWDGAETTISFDLDLTALNEEGDFTIFVLAFNGENEGAFAHANEIRIGIVKTAEGYAMNEMVSGFYEDAAAYEAITAAGKNFTETEVTVSFKVAYEAENNELTYTLSVADQSIENTKTDSNDEIVGFRYLWNSDLNKNGAELSNLVKA